MRDDAKCNLASLGNPIAEHVVATDRLMWRVVLACFLMLSGVVCCAALLYGIAVGAVESIVFPAITLLLFPAGVYILVLVYPYWGLRVVVYPNGLARLRRGRVDVLPWDEIEVVRYFSKGGGIFSQIAGVTYELRLERAAGPCFTLDDLLPDLSGLHHFVTVKTFDRLLARARQVYQAGETVRFGGLGIDRDGVSAAGRVLPWGEVAKFSFVDGRIWIWQKGVARAWYVGPLSYCANSHILPALVAQILQVAPTADTAPSPGAEPLTAIQASAPGGTGDDRVAAQLAPRRREAPGGEPAPKAPGEDYGRPVWSRALVTQLADGVRFTLPQPQAQATFRALAPFAVVALLGLSFLSSFVILAVLQPDRQPQDQGAADRDGLAVAIPAAAVAIVAALGGCWLLYRLWFGVQESVVELTASRLRVQSCGTWWSRVREWRLEEITGIRLHSGLLVTPSGRRTRLLTGDDPAEVYWLAGLLRERLGLPDAPGDTMCLSVYFKSHQQARGMLGSFVVVPGKMILFNHDPGSPLRLEFRRATLLISLRYRFPFFQDAQRPIPINPHDLACRAEADEDSALLIGYCGGRFTARVEHEEPEALRRALLLFLGTDKTSQEEDMG
jgi:hypothetical protein